MGYLDNYKLEVGSDFLPFSWKRQRLSFCENGVVKWKYKNRIVKVKGWRKIKSLIK